MGIEDSVLTVLLAYDAQSSHWTGASNVDQKETRIEEEEAALGLRPIFRPPQWLCNGLDL